MPKITIEQPVGDSEVFTADDKTLLAGLELAGSAIVPVGCRGGGCGICRVKVLSGQYETKKMSRAHISEDGEKEGLVLACRTLPKSDLRIVLATPQAIANRQQRIQAKKTQLITEKEV